MRVYLEGLYPYAAEAYECKVEDVAADSIYANNANKSSVQNMGYPHPLCARAAKMSL